MKTTEDDNQELSKKQKMAYQNRKKKKPDPDNVSKIMLRRRYNTTIRRRSKMVDCRRMYIRSGQANKEIRWDQAWRTVYKWSRPGNKRQPHPGPYRLHKDNIGRVCPRACLCVRAPLYPPACNFLKKRHQLWGVAVNHIHVTYRVPGAPAPSKPHPTSPSTPSGWSWQKRLVKKKYVDTRQKKVAGFTSLRSSLFNN